MSRKSLRVHEKDNVLVALQQMKSGETVDEADIQVRLVTDVPAKFKVALEDLSAGDRIIMYGILVGKATTNIRKGEVLTTENVKHQSAKVTAKKSTITWEGPDISRFEGRTFNGYLRPDGQAGTANIWLFFPLVFCENRNIEILKEVFEKELYPEQVNDHRMFLRQLVSSKSADDGELTVQRERVFENVDVRFITHQAGCGGTREDAEALARLLAGYLTNPNVAGATVLSLGCQNLQIEIFREALNRINPDFNKPLIMTEQQQMGTIDNMLQSIIRETFEKLKEINEIPRQAVPLSKLTIGLECGGSDGFSGVSANPTLGYVSDLLTKLGGSPVLSEFPELCGVEQELVDRCVSEKDAERFLQLMKDYEGAAVESGSGFDMNPSPGNIRDGLITDAMKSAGAAKKGGTSPVTAVLDYGDYVRKPGLNLLCTPGNDVESTTALAGAGANIILFTTGLGTPTGNPVTPVIKVSSNTTLAEKMPDIIDFDTGPVISGEKSIPEMGEELLEYIIRVASGEEKTCAMRMNQNDFIPWKRGVSL